MKFEEKTTASRRIYDGRIVSLREDDVVLPSGIKAKREIVEHYGAVAVIALTDKNEIVFVRQYRKPAEGVMLEIPAGMMHKGEAAEATAGRELEEEAGYKARKILKVLEAYTSPGYSTEIIRYCIATDLIKVQQRCDEDENIRVELIGADKALNMIEQGEIKDNKTIVGIHLALKHKGK